MDLAPCSSTTRRTLLATDRNSLLEGAVTYRGEHEGFLVEVCGGTPGVTLGVFPSGFPVHAIRLDGLGSGSVSLSGPVNPLALDHSVQISVRLGQDPVLTGMLPDRSDRQVQPDEATRAGSGRAMESSPVPASEAVLALDPVDLARLDQAQLHDRVESKVILPTVDIPSALSRLAEDYLVLEHESQRLQSYRNEYFDSCELRNYHEHHNQNGRRFKLRYRSYMNSDLTFFEVKQNINGRTVKKRRRSHRPSGQRLWHEDELFFHELTGNASSHFVPSLTVDYERVLLVKRDFSERVTIDLNLTFRSPNGKAEIPGLAICEFKQPRLDRRSPAMAAMNRRPQMFSKYCMGLASCDPSLRRNRFKKVFRNLDALGTPPTKSQPTDHDPINQESTNTNPINHKHEGQPS